MLEQQGMCTRDQAVALQDCRTLRTIDDYDGPWESAAAASVDVLDGYRLQLVSGLHHLKMSVDDAAQPMAKAYLWYGHRRLDASGRWRR
jgi:hypothetical protein